jgi:hypothetical protein
VTAGRPGAGVADAGPWLAVSDEPAALVSGGYFFHQQQQFHRAARSAKLQDALTDYCARLSAIPVPA